ncbi:Eukaryotic aspartyl protease family protein [Euphorbia peplus]|nr:Eukaryotic aspartyl protease family protein [Euphorbia peplus]
MPKCHVSTLPHLFLYIFTFSILLFVVISKHHNGFSFELVHRDSISLLDLENTKSSNFNKLSKLDTNPQGLRFELTHSDRLTYLVKLQFGSPSIPIYLFPDTGSHLFWTQCEPCTYRFHQAPPIYNSSASHTYAKLPCNHHFCRYNNSTFTCQHGECVYKLHYMSNSSTAGVAASDIFHLANNKQMQIKFGCSDNSQNFGSRDQLGRFGGILGLNMSPVSILQQLYNVTQRRFSYCLPPNNNVSTLLRFGDDIATFGRIFKSIRIVSPLYRNSYYLDLRDISVDSHRLNFTLGTFRLQYDGHGGCVIDSATSYTRFIEPAYRKIIGAFQLYYERYGLQRVRVPNSGLELCYKNSQKLPKLAAMTYHFDGADFEVDANNIYRRIEHTSDVFCVEIKSSPSLTILGTMHQINTRFIYDLNARRILFAREDCRFDI